MSRGAVDCRSTPDKAVKCASVEKDLARSGQGKNEIEDDGGETICIYPSLRH